MGELTPGVSKTDYLSTRRMAGSGSPFNFIEGVDRDHGGNACRPERLDKKLLYLVLKRLTNDVMIRLEMGGREPKTLVDLCKLKCQRGEGKRSLQKSDALERPLAKTRSTIIRVIVEFTVRRVC